MHGDFPQLSYAASMHKLLIIVFGFLPLVVSAEIYKWVDDMGVTHYGDQAHQGAKKIELPKTQPLYPSRSKQPSLGNNAGKRNLKDGGNNYNSFSIAQPENNQTFRDHTGTVNVTFFLDPGLRTGHKIRVLLDGQPLKDMLTSTRFALQGIDRGTHSVRAEIVDENGAKVISASSVSFHMRKQLLQGVEEPNDKTLEPNYKPNAPSNYKSNYSP